MLIPLCPVSKRELEVNNLTDNLSVNSPQDSKLDAVDKLIINELQRGFPVVAEPYKVVAEQFGISESELLERITNLLDKGILSRFGPMYHAERLGGGLSLAAMQIPEDAFEQVVAIVNSFDEVAHNYARDHALNMWFVLATESADEVASVIRAIEKKSGYRVFNMPKEKEFFVGLHFSV